MQARTDWLSYRVLMLAVVERSRSGVARDIQTRDESVFGRTLLAARYSSVLLVFVCVCVCVCARAV